MLFRSVLYDPPDVSLALILNGATTHPTPLRIAQGVYRLDYTAAEAGTLQYVWGGLGNVLGPRSGIVQIDSAPSTALLGWDPSGDHQVFDGLEPVTLFDRSGASIYVPRALRLPTTGTDQNAGPIAAFGATVSWNLWVMDCPRHPEINGAIRDAYGKTYRIDSVTKSVLKQLYEINTTADAGGMT